MEGTAAPATLGSAESDHLFRIYSRTFHGEGTSGPGLGLAFRTAAWAWAGGWQKLRVLQATRGAERSPSGPGTAPAAAGPPRRPRAAPAPERPREGPRGAGALTVTEKSDGRGAACGVPPSPSARESRPHAEFRILLAGVFRVGSAALGVGPGPRDPLAPLFPTRPAPGGTRVPGAPCSRFLPRLEPGKVPPAPQGLCWEPPGRRPSGPHARVPRPTLPRGRFSPLDTQTHLFTCVRAASAQLNELQFVIFMVNLNSRSCWLILLLGGTTGGGSRRSRRESNRHWMSHYGHRPPQPDARAAAPAGGPWRTPEPGSRRAPRLQSSEAPCGARGYARRSPEPPNHAAPPPPAPARRRLSPPASLSVLPASRPAGRPGPHQGGERRT